MFVCELVPLPTHPQTASRSRSAPWLGAKPVLTVRISRPTGWTRASRDAKDAGEVVAGVFGW